MNTLKPILIAIKITKKEVIKARDLFESIFKFKKFPMRPPAKTAKKSGQYEKVSFNIVSFVSCPKTPEIELISMNKDAVVAIFLGLSSFNKKRIGLKKIPPPIPTIPEISPKTEPIEIEMKKLIFFIVIFLSS